MMTSGPAPSLPAARNPRPPPRKETATAQATAVPSRRVLAATAPDLAVVRLRRHSGKWDSRDIHERFGYRYT